MCERNLDIDKPRFDQSTYIGRCRHFFSTTSPLNLFKTNEELEESKRIVTAARDQKWDELACLSNYEIWKAKELYDSAYHPETGELIFPLGRMSAQVPSNMAITGCMMSFYKSTKAVMFWQWINQSFNAVVNYSNRSGESPVSVPQLSLSYVLATSGAVTTALLFNAITKRAPNLIGRCVPFVAVAAANCINIPFMRLQELKEGVVITDEEGTKLGVSTEAAKRGVTATTYSRIAMAAPSMITTPIVINSYDKKGAFRRFPWIVTPFSILICGICLTFATPMCCALFEQRASMPTSELEDGIRQRVEEKGVDRVYYNKGL